MVDGNLVRYAWAGPGGNHDEGRCYACGPAIQAVNLDSTIRHEPRTPMKPLNAVSPNLFLHEFPMGANHIVQTRHEAGNFHIISHAKFKHIPGLEKLHHLQGTLA